MRIDSFLLFVLMVLKLVSVVPMVYKDYGAGVGASVLLAVVGIYSVLIYFCETEQRTSSAL
jgi:hypothetical protein